MSERVSTITINSGLAISALAVIAAVLVLLAFVTGISTSLAEKIGIASGGLGFIALLMILFIFFSGLGIAFIGSCLATYSELAEEKKILNDGFSAEAKILSIEQEQTSEVGSTVKVDFRLEVYPANQPKFMGWSTQNIELIRIPSYQPEKIVQVKYLPEISKVLIIGAKAV